MHSFYSSTSYEISSWQKGFPLKHSLNIKIKKKIHSTKYELENGECQMKRKLIDSMLF